MITATQKTEISQLLAVYVDTFSSQSKAAASLKGVSEALIIQVLKSNWKDISDAAWINIGKQIGYFAKHSFVETQDVRTMVDFFTIAREEGANFAITGNPGSSKTSTAKYFEANNRKTGVYHIQCSEYWNKKQFLAAILSKMGVVNTGFNVGEMMSAIVTNLRRQHQPLIIIDEIDKLSDPVFLFYITLYNELHGLCGICLLGTDYLQKRIIRGVERNTKGYKEIYSRLGSKFITLDGTDAEEVAEICLAHGIDNPMDISEIVNSYKGDLRAVDRKVLKIKMASRKK